ncbi:protein EDS1B-like, partial [Corylus avellana]|uniref:protein EDS1B-like n=1 Tax=Corylus avellana TaxID=13451 RepID=UPI00286BAA4D
YQVQSAVTDRKQIVFTGHSLGGSIAILATLWFLEKFFKSDSKIPPLCLTFGCPLTGNRIFSHALGRENWASYFIHFVMRYDIVPRLLLAPIPSIEQEFESILQFFAAKSTNESAGGVPEEASDFHMIVMRNAASVATHAACNLMGSTNMLLETVTSFIALSPYKPFGTYIFCTGNGKLVVLRNPDAVLQLLFYSSQLGSEREVAEIPCLSLHQHFGYESELQESLEMQDVVDLKQLETLPLSAEVTGGDSATINSALNDLGLSTRARLCLRAAGVLEKRKQGNKRNIDAKEKDIHNAMNELETSYRAYCKLRKVGCYDAFKLQKNRQDFDANLKRLTLTGIWDEIIDMLKRYELPDDFEGQRAWVELGTRYRRLVEPLDIANYYRHLKNEDTGPYATKGRPKRFRYTQRWREHAEKMPAESSGESHFWAEVEELQAKTGNGEGFEEVKERVLKLERNIQKWVNGGEVEKDVLLEESTLVKWWKTLPQHHKLESCISGLIKN